MEDHPKNDRQSDSQERVDDAKFDSSSLSFEEIEKNKPVSFDFKYNLRLDLLSADQREEIDAKDYLDLEFNQLAVDNKFGKLLVYYGNALFIFDDLDLKENLEENISSVKMDSLVRKPSRIEIPAKKIFSTDDFLVLIDENRVVRAFFKEDFYQGSRSNPRFEFEIEDPGNLQIIENRLVFMEKREIVSFDLSSEEKQSLQSDLGENSKFAVNDEYIAYSLGKEVFLRSLSENTVKKSKFTHEEIHKMHFTKEFLCLVNMTKPNLVLLSIEEFDGKDGLEESKKVSDVHGIEEMEEDLPEIDLHSLRKSTVLLFQTAFQLSVVWLILELKN